MSLDTAQRPKREPGPFSFTAAVVFNTLVLALINAHDTWRPLLGGAITERFSETLWALNLGAGAQIVGNLVLLSGASPLRRRLFELLFAATGLVGSITMFRVFPFDLDRFGPAAPVAARVLVTLGVVGSVVALVVSVVKLLGRGGRSGTPAHP